MKLGLVLERAGRIDEALATYQTALDVYPGHVPTIQALARLQIRTGRGDNKTREYLSTIALEGESEQWRAVGARAPGPRCLQRQRNAAGCPTAMTACRPFE
jgi:hypothetical protein